MVPLWVPPLTSGKLNSFLSSILAFCHQHFRYTQVILKKKKTPMSFKMPPPQPSSQLFFWRSSVVISWYLNQHIFVILILTTSLAFGIKDHSETRFTWLHPTPLHIFLFSPRCFSGNIFFFIILPLRFCPRSFYAKCTPWAIASTHRTSVISYADESQIISSHIHHSSSRVFRYFYWHLAGT